jgi:hypothetical protein
VNIEAVPFGRTVRVRYTFARFFDDYQTVPKSLKVELPMGLSDEELRTFSHRLISGETPSNALTATRPIHE